VEVGVEVGVVVVGVGVGLPTQSSTMATVEELEQVPKEVIVIVSQESDTSTFNPANNCCFVAELGETDPVLADSEKLGPVSPPN
jgi:hypothetical protein